VLNPERLSEQHSAPTNGEERHVRTTRLEAFSDGVLAIVITIMVLDLKRPDGASWGDFGKSLPSIYTYLLSFVYIAIYWNNHHHLMQLLDRVTGSILWANMALLFCLSLTPFTTSWMHEKHFASAPTVVYGIGLLLNAIAYTALVRAMMRSQPPDGPVRRAFGNDIKGLVSLAIYIVGITLSFFWVPGGIACYVLVALIWLIPDRRVERLLTARDVARGGAGQGEA
jgi:uncharacterized membrane protein